jgi:hypothetical protein
MRYNLITQRLTLTIVFAIVTWTVAPCQAARFDASRDIKFKTKQKGIQK